ncbi:hypothetical protein M5K25_022039 [Dendrobium thyrsiflorum]|uniref:NB-ARC domain-containing protein n=1 Tax=Dendrobium thyrsiflorum TaxID=117978 RepID=A0ABD0U5F6_DENTH
MCSLFYHKTFICFESSIINCETSWIPKLRFGMAGITSSIISNLLSSLKRLSQVMPICTSLTASSSSSSSSIVGDEVMVVDVNSIQESLMEDLSRLSRMMQRIQALLDEAEVRDVLRVTKEIVKSIIKSSIHEDNNNLNDLHCILKEALLDKQFLLILDDVWNERPDMWEALQAPFSGIRMGKIIVTTRSMSVARIMQTVSPLNLECLHEEDSWLLFQKHAFYGWEPNQQLNFEQIGRGIIKKCGGLPLALKAVGGFLRFEYKVQIWKDVLNSNLWELEEIKNLILPALRISYNYLPTHLKSCFLYASLCPKNYLFCKLEMMGMWIAQGYIQLARRKRLLEDLAFEFFEELVRSSFFQCSKFLRFQPEKERWFEEWFSLHDMMKDLAQFITKNEICALLNFGELKDIPKDAKHIFLKHIKVNQILLHGAIRTLDNIVSDHLYGVLDQSIFSKQSFSYLGYLRVLRFDAPNFDCSF